MVVRNSSKGFTVPHRGEGSNRSLNDLIEFSTDEQLLGGLKHQLENNSDLPLRTTVYFPVKPGDTIPFGGFEGTAPPKLFASSHPPPLGSNSVEPTGFSIVPPRISGTGPGGNGGSSSNPGDGFINTYGSGGFGGLAGSAPPAETKLPLKPKEIKQIDQGFTGIDRAVRNEGTIYPEDNFLNQFDSYTYKWTFFAARYEVHNGEEDWENAQKIIIAEDGAGARFFINDVEMTTITSLNSKTRIMPHTQFEFRIDEPKGVNFFDNLMNAARNLGVPDHLKIPYYLSLEFYGEDRNGNTVKIDDYSYIWSIIIVNMKVDVTEDGSRYNFEAIATDDVPTMNQYAIIPATFTIRAETIGEFFEAVEKKLNEYESQHKDIHYLVIDEYKFQIDDEVKNIKIGSLEKSAETAKQKFDLAYSDEQGFTIPKGYDLGTLVENLMVACEEWWPEIYNKEPKKDQDSDSNFSKVWKIETSMDFIDYDLFRQDYARKYTFHIFPTTLERSNRYENQDEEERTKQIINVFNVSKVYDYIYTGLNTEVLNFNFELDYLWFNKIPMITGQNLNLSYNSPRITNRQIRTRTAVAREYEQSTKTFQDLNSVTNADAFSQNIINYEKSTSNYVTYNTNIKDPKVEAKEREAFLKSEEFQQSLDPVTGLTVAEAKKLNDQINSSKSLVRRTVFIEDLSKGESLTNNKKLNINRPIIHSLRISPERADIAKKYAIEGTDLEDRAYIANYLDYYMNAEMTQINLEIRGDPFWIGRSKTMRKWTYSDAEIFVPFRDLSSKLDVDYSYKDNLFGLILKSPKTENVDGFYEVENNDLYTGFYQVIQVTHKFSNGRFTQSLEAVKDPLTSGFSVQEAVKNK